MAQFLSFGWIGPHRLSAYADDHLDSFIPFATLFNLPEGS